MAMNNLTAAVAALSVSLGGGPKADPTGLSGALASSGVVDRGALQCGHGAAPQLSPPPVAGGRTFSLPPPGTPAQILRESMTYFPPNREESRVDLDALRVFETYQRGMEPGQKISGRQMRALIDAAVSDRDGKSLTTEPEAVYDAVYSMWSKEQLSDAAKAVAGAYFDLINHSIAHGERVVSEPDLKAYSARVDRILGDLDPEAVSAISRVADGLATLPFEDLGTERGRAVHALIDDALKGILRTMKEQSADIDQVMPIIEAYNPLARVRDLIATRLDSSDANAAMLVMRELNKTGQSPSEMYRTHVTAITQMKTDLGAQ